MEEFAADQIDGIQDPANQRFLTEYLLGNVLGLQADALVFCLGVRYLLQNKADRRAFRIMIAVLVVLLAVHWSFIVSDTMYSFVAGFGNLDRALSTSFQYTVFLSLNGFIIALVQGFYAWRCFCVVQRNYFVLAVASLFALASAAVWTWIAVSLYYGLSFYSTNETIGWMQSLRYIVTTAGDIFIVCCMLWSLRQIKLRSHHQGSGRILVRILTLLVSTNGLTTIVSVIALISSILNWGVDIVTDPIIAALYGFTLLIWMEARKATNRKISTIQPASVSEAPPVFKLRQRLNSQDPEKDIYVSPLSTHGQIPDSPSIEASLRDVEKGNDDIDIDRS